MRIAAVLCVCACSSPTVANDAATNDASMNDAPPACDITGTWTGTIDNVAFPSGSGAIAFTLANASAPMGTVIFGNAPPPAPPTDPNAAYPPGFMLGQLQQPMPSQYVEGFVFTVQGGTFDGTRLQFGVVAEQVFEAWCALQTQIWGDGADGGAPYACLPPWNFFCNGQTQICVSTNPQNSSDTITYAQEKQDLCSPGGTCTCTATSCVAPTKVDITFDATCASSTLEGTIAGALGNHAVHLKK